MTTTPAAEPTIEVICYNAHQLKEASLHNVAAVRDYLSDDFITWFNIDGCPTSQQLDELAATLGLHELAREDVGNQNQRAKVDDYESHIYVVMRMLDRKKFPETEQLNIFLGKTFVLTVQERTGGDGLDPVRERLRHNRGRVRRMGGDYLMYCIVDQVVDDYFPLLEAVGERIERLEDKVLKDNQQKLAGRIHEIKREIQSIRRAVWPLRDAVNILCRDTHPLIRHETRVYLRDCYDHVLRMIDLIETYRELAHDLMDIYLSAVNTRMNEVMKVLTIITTLFIPPTFIAGVYGMNFDHTKSPWNMPELEWYYGYPSSLLLMVLLAGMLTLFLYRKGWLSSGKKKAK